MKKASRVGSSRRKKTAAPPPRRSALDHVKHGLATRTAERSQGTTPRVIVRTPYPTLDETAATLGMSVAKARRIAALVRTELLRRNPVTGALEIAELLADSPLAHELVTRKVSPKTTVGLARRRRRTNVAP